MLYEMYDSYAEDARVEFGDTAKVMTFKEWCDWYCVDEDTPEEILSDIFW